MISYVLTKHVTRCGRHGIGWCLNQIIAPQKDKRSYLVFKRGMKREIGMGYQSDVGKGEEYWGNGAPPHLYRTLFEDSVNSYDWLRCDVQIKTTAEE